MQRWLAPLMVAALVAGCARTGAAPALPAGRKIKVVAGAFPLAELARRVGLNRVTVTDLTPAGTDPGRVGVDPALAQAQVVLLVGRGFQPGLERAAAGRPGALELWDSLGGDDPHFWLDPVTMQRAADLVGDALARVDPAGEPAYRAAARSFNAQLSSLDINYRSSLAGCARRDLVTAYGGFARLAGRYGLVSHAATDPGILPLIRARAVRTVFTEPPLPPDTAEALARAANIKSAPLGTLESRTPAEAARGAGYVTLMTNNLAALRTALACTEASP